MNHLLELMRSVDLGKHSVYNSLPERPKIARSARGPKFRRALCRRRIGRVVPRAENFGGLITADHKFLSEGCDSRYNHRFAVVVQDLAPQWKQFYHCKTKNFSGNRKELAKVLGAE